MTLSELLTSGPFLCGSLCGLVLLYSLVAGRVPAGRRRLFSSFYWAYRQKDPWSYWFWLSLWTALLLALLAGYWRS